MELFQTICTGAVFYSIMIDIREIQGLKFGKLSPIEYMGKPGNKWKCKCDCGSYITIKAYHIKSGHIKSCGCLRKEILAANRVVNLTGRTFTRLKVIKLSHTDKWRNSNWICLCNCGNYKTVPARYLHSGRVRSCGCLKKDFNLKSSGKCKCKNCNCLYHRGGKSNPRYNHQLTEKDRLPRQFIPELKIWRKAILRRDNYTCQITNCKSNRLIVHHIEGWTTNKELRFVTSNGITLCKLIHTLFHKIYGYGQNTTKQFTEFKDNYNKGEFDNILPKDLKRKALAPL